MRISIPQLAAEFVIVFVGVAVALAADEWRQNLQNWALERSYLERLESDLQSGRGRIETYNLRFDTVLEATSQLIQIIESENSIADADADETFNLAVAAARSGFNSYAITYSATYDELIATGNLAIIRDENLRMEIVDHFRQASGFVEEVEDLPLAYNARFKSITGYAPNSYYQGRIESTPLVKERLLFELENNDQLLAELRLFQAEFGVNRIFKNSIEAINYLLTKL